MAPRSTARVTAEDADAADQAKTKAEPAEEKAAASADAEEKSGTEYLNVSGAPLVYDAEGHQVGNGEWITANLDKVGQAARRSGYLLPRSAL